MEILRKYIDLAGKIRADVLMDDLSVISIKVSGNSNDSYILQQTELIYNIRNDLNEIESWVTITFDIDFNIIKDVIIKLKNNPSITLTQYNNYLATKQWYEAATIRYFVYKLALGLEQSYDFQLTDYTEAKILQKVRDWIVATPLRKIGKVVMNNVNELE